MLYLYLTFMDATIFSSPGLELLQSCQKPDVICKVINTESMNIF